MESEDTRRILHREIPIHPVSESCIPPGLVGFNTCCAPFHIICLRNVILLIFGQTKSSSSVEAGPLRLELSSRLALVTESTMRWLACRSLVIALALPVRIQRFWSAVDMMVTGGNLPVKFITQRETGQNKYNASGLICSITIIVKHSLSLHTNNSCAK